MFVRSKGVSPWNSEKVQKAMWLSEEGAANSAGHTGSIAATPRGAFSAYDIACDA